MAGRSTFVGCISHARRPRLYWCSFALEVFWAANLSEHAGCVELVIPGGPGPVTRWKKPSVHWGRRDDADRFSTFLRASFNKSEPWLPNGIDRCSPEALALWKSEGYRYSPYQYMPPNVLVEKGVRRTLNATEREQLLDFLPRHTLTTMATRARSGNPAQLELARCSLLGDTFACGVVAFLLQHLLFQLGYMSRLLSIDEMRGTALAASVGSLSRAQQEIELARAHAGRMYEWIAMRLWM